MPFLTHLIQVGQLPTHKSTAEDSVMIHVCCRPAGTILIDNHFLLHAWKWAYTRSTHVYHALCQFTCTILHVHSGLGIPHSPVDNNTLLLPCQHKLRNGKRGKFRKTRIMDCLLCFLFLWVASHQLCSAFDSSTPNISSQQLLPYTILLNTTAKHCQTMTRFSLIS